MTSPGALSDDVCVRIGRVARCSELSVLLRYSAMTRGIHRLLRLLPVLVLACTCSAQPSAPNLRLPSGVRPLHYAADLALNPGQDAFTGSIEIALEVSQPADRIWLHGKELEFREARFRVAGKDVPAHSEPHGDFIAIIPDAPLTPGRVGLHIVYAGQVSRTLTDGLFQQRDGEDWYIFSKFEPVTARRAFPCFDEPSFKTPWQLTLHVPKQLRAFSNTAMESETEEPGGTKAVRFAETKPLPSYLVALAVGPFDVVETAPVGQKHIPSRIIVPRGRGSEAAHAAAITPKIIELLEAYFGTPYPYDKLDQIVVPLVTSWGAMENAGLIAYGQFLIAPKQQDSELRQRSRAETMAHEISHQWFGDLVTTAWWDDIWLNEAFATWMSNKVLDQWHPEWKLKFDAASSSNRVMHADELVSARRVRQPIEAPGDIANAFDGITYQKGAAVISMFENYVGSATFQKAVRLYLKQHAWGNATAEDLLAAVDTISGRSVGPAFLSFLNQGGVPLLKVGLRCGGKSPVLTLAQERFLPLGSKATPSEVWQVPVCFKWSDGRSVRRQCVLLAKPAEEFTIPEAKSCPAWLYASENAAGYYRISYAPELLRALLQEGQSQLELPERASVLENTQALFETGRIDASDALGAASKLSNDPNREIVLPALGTIASINSLVPDPLRPNFARFVNSAYGARARDLGWKSRTGEPQDAQQLRGALVPTVAMWGEDAALAAEASKLAHAWLKDRNAIDPDMVYSVLATAAYKGDRALFDELVSAAKASKVQRDRSFMIYAIGGFRDPEIERSALALLFSGDIDPRELSPILYRSRKETWPVAWEFVKENFDRLNSLLPGARGIPFAATLPYAANGFCDAASGVHERRHAQSLHRHREYPPVQRADCRDAAGHCYIPQELLKGNLCYDCIARRPMEWAQAGC
jgi:alanyl aminopeptidase